MGYTEGRATQDDADNHFGIPEGLVKKRREELIQAIIFAVPATEQQEAEKPLPADTVFKKQGQLTHPTQSRPVPPHRLPTRYSRHAPGARILFAGASCEQEQGEYKAMSDINVLDQIKNAISSGISRYKSRPGDAAHGRHEPGWFTNWRHGAEGVKQAESLLTAINQCGTVERVIIELTLFFLDSKRRYENNSLSMYLLDALNILLSQHAYPGLKPEGDAPYDKFTWISISAQLKQLEAASMMSADCTPSPRY